MYSPSRASSAQSPSLLSPCLNKQQLQTTEQTVRALSSETHFPSGQRACVCVCLCAGTRTQFRCSGGCVVLSMFFTVVCTLATHQHVSIWPFKTTENASKREENRSGMVALPLSGESPQQSTAKNHKYTRKHYAMVSPELAGNNPQHKTFSIKCFVI